MIFLIAQCSIDLAAQKEDNIWFFGVNTVNEISLGYQWGTSMLDFSEIEPIFYYDSTVTMDFIGANASISDKHGNIQLYTNGMHMHDSTHTDIINGDTIAYSDYWENWVKKDFLPDGSDWISGFPIIQAISILPIKGDKYYAIYKVGEYDGESYPLRSLNFSLIEKNEAGRYEITEKDLAVRSDIYNFGQVNACRHANGRDWWLLQQNVETDSLLVFLINDNGIELKNTHHTPESVDIGLSFSQVAFSPDGTKYAMSSLKEVDDINSQIVSVYNFDRCDGNLSSEGYRDTFQNFAIFPVVAFSPNSQYLYTSSYDTMFQYDLEEADWASSRMNVADYDGFFFQYNEFNNKQPTKLGPMALAPDGRIYSVPPGNNRYLHSIEYPDERGLESNVIQHKIMIPTSNFRSIPNFPHYRLGPLDGSICDSLYLDNNPIAQYRFVQDTSDYLNVRFTDISYFRPETWSWDFGDGTTYEGKKPYYHSFPEDGVYNVCLTVSNENNEDTFCKTLFLGVTSVEKPLLSDNQVLMYPNPVEAELYIELKDYLPSNAQLKIYNSLGQIVVEERIFAGWNNFNISDIKGGIYYFTIHDMDIIYSNTFIKY